MAQLTALIATQKESLPSGVTAAGIKVSVADQVATLTEAPYQAAFTLASGSYTVTSEAIDSTGATIGSPIQQTVTIPADSYDAPVSISVTLG